MSRDVTSAHRSPPDEIPLAAVESALRREGLLLETRGPLPATVAGITDNSRFVRAGTLFLAVRGSQRDGHAYLPSAESAGATVALVEDASATMLPALVVRDGRRAAAVAAAAAFGEPARALRLVAVTGTNGKTTTVNLLRHLLDAPGMRAASIGTLGVLVGSEGTVLPGGGGLTTPGPVELQRVLRALVDDGVTTVAMEVSSHSLHQHRVEGLAFDVAVFTNLTRDHLDYHGTMEAYRNAKARLLDYLTPTGTAVINADDPAWRTLPAAPRTLRCSSGAAVADVYARRVQYGPRGSEWTLHVPEAPAQKVRLPLIGDFNVANAVAAAAVAHASGIPARMIAERLERAPQIPGRLELLAESPTVLRDYAHTPDALERALDAVRPFAPRRLVVVFGCGGDRDRGKRPAMGAIAETRADWAIVTSDNPRGEDPERIIDDIEAGMSRVNHERIEDRRQAIARALQTAAPDDVIVLAGKGHETYQIRGARTLPFDEKLIVAELLAAAPHPHQALTP